MGTPYQPEYPAEEPRWDQPHGYRPPPYPQQPQIPGYPGPSGSPYYSYAGYPYDAPFGRDPVTGMPLSDKSATTAGLLQLFFGAFGVGRFYIDSTQIGAIQLCLGIAGIFATVFLCGLGLPVLLGVGIWAFIDAIMMFTGSVPDSYGRKLH